MYSSFLPCLFALAVSNLLICADFLLSVYPVWAKVIAWTNTVARCRRLQTTPRDHPALASTDPCSRKIILASILYQKHRETEIHHSRERTKGAILFLEGAWGVGWRDASNSVNSSVTQSSISLDLAWNRLSRFRSERSLTACLTHGQPCLYPAKPVPTPLQPSLFG